MRAFFDTNILVYLYDADATDKKDRARDLFETEATAGRIVLSTQVLQEFYVVVTRKLGVPLDPKAAEDVVRNLSILPIVHIDTERIPKEFWLQSAGAVNFSSLSGMLSLLKQH